MARSKQLVECVPNFSEGRNLEIIRLITNEIEAVEGVKLLDVDPGEATNRTVVTFVGEPQAVCEAAFRAVFARANSSTCANTTGRIRAWGLPTCCPWCR